MKTPITGLGYYEGMWVVVAIIGIAALATLCAGTALWIWWSRW